MTELGEESKSLESSSSRRPRSFSTEEGLPQAAGFNRPEVERRTQARGSSNPRSSMRPMHTGGDDRAWRARAWRAARRGGPDPSLPKRDYPTLLSLSTPEDSVEEQMLNHVNFAQWSTPQQATFRTEVLWPLPPLSTIDPRSEPEGALPSV
jgi:hypothetical protein